MQPNPASKSCRDLLLGVRSALLALLALGGLQAGVHCQGAVQTGAVDTNAPPLSASGGLSLAALDHAVRNTDVTIVELRRFFDATGMIATTREEVRVDANGTNSAPFSLTYLGLEGDLPGSPKWQYWGQNYQRFAGLLHRHGGFRVRDLALAEANYTLHPFGSVVRAGRPAERLVVFPNRLDKAIWLLEVDSATNIPLYSAEYNASFQLLSEIEAISFTASVQLTNPHSSSMAMTTHPTFAGAALALNIPGLVEPSTSFTGEYQLSTVQVADNPLNNRRSMVLTYTDGVDEFFVIESPGVSEFFAGLPSQSKGNTSATNTIARYQDPTMRVLLFWDDGVGFQVAGRGSLGRLDGVAKSIYTQAVLGH